MDQNLLKTYNSLPEEEKENWLIEHIKNSDITDWKAFPKLTEKSLYIFIEMFQSIIELDDMFMSESKRTYETLANTLHFIAESGNIDDEEFVKTFAILFTKLYRDGYFPSKTGPFRHLNAVSISFSNNSYYIRISFKPDAKAVLIKKDKCVLVFLDVMTDFIKESLLNNKNIE